MSVLLYNKSAIETKKTSFAKCWLKCFQLKSAILGFPLFKVGLPVFFSTKTIGEALG
jgi:hypothetical protein